MIERYVVIEPGASGNQNIIECLNQCGFVFAAKLLLFNDLLSLFREETG